MTGKYDWKITGKKFLWILAEILVAGAFVYITENGFCIFLAPVFEALRNFLKHRND